MVIGLPKQIEVAPEEEFYETADAAIKEAEAGPAEKPTGIKARKPAGAKAKPKVQRKKKFKEEQAPLTDVAEPAPEPPKAAQQDAAKSFFEATAGSQAFVAATEGLLGAVRLGLPDSDVYFQTKPIEETTNQNGVKVYSNQAIVSLYKLPDGTRESPSEPRLWLVDRSLVAAFKEKKAKIRDYQLRLAVDRQGTPYLIPVPVDAHDIWGTSLRTVMQHSDRKWLKIFSDSKKGRLHEFGEDQSLEPTYPTEDFQTLYMLALMPVFINSMEHDIYKRICGA